jgi:hypothetical protein
MLGPCDGLATSAKNWFNAYLLAPLLPAQGKKALIRVAHLDTLPTLLGAQPVPWIFQSASGARKTGLLTRYPG